MSNAEAIVYLNGDYVALGAATVPVMDRGFLFGDGVYEVIPVYAGRPFRLDDHLTRLARSLHEVRIPEPLDAAGWAALVDGVVTHHGGGDLGIYVQVTRGAAATRDHAIPDGLVPTVFAMPLAIPPRPADLGERGIAAVTREDIRWARCDIKAITLLANVLLRDEASAAGAQEVLLVRDGLVTEGSASNVFAAHDGRLLTPPCGHQILPGITRIVLLELAAEAGIAVDERPLPVAELAGCDEILVCSSTREVSPVTQLDGRPVGDGRPGPVWRELDRRYQEFKARLRAAP